jgi:hypothetical protein
MADLGGPFNFDNSTGGNATPSLPSGSSFNLGVPGLNNLASTLGLTGSNTSNASSSPQLPWTNRVGSLFFHYTEIIGGRWDGLYPYRLMVVDTAYGRPIIVNGDIDDLDFNISATIGTTDAFISIQPVSPSWVIQLPITPQQLSITDQYSINVSASLRGILEEHNGVKFKMISASGSFGVWAARPSADTAPQTNPSILQSVFGGTISAFNNVVNQVQGVVNTITSGHPSTGPATIRPENVQGQNGLQSTGYYRALAVQQFLEQYAEAKKDPANATWRLVLDMPKQNNSYVVTPIAFSWQQNQSRPMEIMYNMQFKGWRRINLTEDVNIPPSSNQPISVGVLQRILNTVAQARSATSAALNLLAAVQSDIEQPLNVLRQTSLLVKGLAGVAVTAADMPYQIQRDYSSAISSFFSSLSLDSLTGTGATSPSVIAAVKSIQATNLSLEGVSIGAVSTGQLGTTAQQGQPSNPSNTALQNPEGNYNLFDQAPVSSLSLTPQQQSAVDAATESAQALTIADLKQFRSTIQSLAIALSNSFGTGDAYYNQIFGLAPPNQLIAPITLDQYDLLQSLYDTMLSYDLLTASTTLDDESTLSNMEYVAGLAATSGIQFDVPNSKIVAPVPFGVTIEGIALRYLGDPLRWIEIATLNNLQEPYIDEDGFQLPLLSNAIGRQVIVGSSDNLYIGQTVTVLGSGQTPSSRTIGNIQTLSEFSFLITLSGLANLGNFTLANQAYVQAYLPGTVNSQQKIFIPSDLPPPEDNSIIQPPSTTGDPLTGLSKVDLLLTDTGDIAINNYGDFRFSYGMTNIIQALKIKLATSAGTMITHPEFGLGIGTGISVADLDAKGLYKKINALIQADSRFAGLSSLQISQSGPQLNISLGVQIAGKSGVFPVNFQLTP